MGRLHGAHGVLPRKHRPPRGTGAPQGARVAPAATAQKRHGSTGDDNDGFKPGETVEHGETADLRGARPNAPMKAA